MKEHVVFKQNSFKYRNGLLSPLAEEYFTTGKNWISNEDFASPPEIHALALKYRDEGFYSKNSFIINKRKIVSSWTALQIRASLQLFPFHESKLFLFIKCSWNFNFPVTEYSAPFKPQKIFYLLECFSFRSFWANICSAQLNWKPEACLYLNKAE